jgi:hypothetical protein
MRRPAILGVDFTSSPRPRKAITVARGRLARRAFVLDAVDALPDWPSFERLLAAPGPWVGGFDFPFGLPREAVRDLGWPEEWPALVRHCAALGRAAFRIVLDDYRVSRPVGRKYPHRATDLPAGSHSPVKLVNPPVALMFLEGAPRLLAAGLSIPGLHRGDPQRVAVEAYPGFAARAITPASYKADEKRKQTPARRKVRAAVVTRLARDGGPFGFALAGPRALLRSLVADAAADRLDAVLAAMQAAWCLRRRVRNYGLPAAIDPLEGWIATAGPVRRPLSYHPASMVSAATEIDALRMALLAVCSPEHTAVHRIHGELEHWLNRQLATADIEAALAELAASGLVAARSGGWLTTDSGRSVVAARWEEFFPE